LVSPANFHSTNCSTITIIYHLGLVEEASTKWTQPHPTKNNKKIKNKKKSSLKYLLTPKLTPYRTLFSSNLGTPHAQHVADGRSLEVIANYNSFMIG
jgi:hypothetical protein